MTDDNKWQIDKDTSIMTHSTGLRLILTKKGGKDFDAMLVGLPGERLASIEVVDELLSSAIQAYLAFHKTLN